jgi:hypothetical protein
LEGIVTTEEFDKRYKQMELVARSYVQQAEESWQHGYVLAAAAKFDRAAAQLKAMDVLAEAYHLQFDEWDQRIETNPDIDPFKAF